jgi:putative flippase GtrA
MNLPMEKIVRWAKFNMVGAVGMAVQLGSLALINRLAPGHDMVATAIALEITLLHNFVWHLHYTWRDRRCQNATARQLIRFHLSNGLVSLVGNLALMPVLVDGARIPVITANAIAILCCSIVNFFLGDQWAFVRPAIAAASPMPHE